MSNKDWDPNLTPEQNYVLRQEGTESPGSSPLNNEKREGSYHCVGCGTKLFDSTTKYESCLLYTSPSPRDATLSRMPSSA